jgi:hypothetical protein
MHTREHLNVVESMAVVVATSRSAVLFLFSGHLLRPRDC